MGEKTRKFIERILEKQQQRMGGVMAEIQAVGKITTQDGGELFVNILETWHGFRAGDMVAGETWSGEKGVVDGVHEHDGAKALWVTITGDDCSTIVVSPNGLILLERPSLKFKVGDCVKALRNTGPSKLEGKVIAINPDSGHYLVEFPAFIHGGHDGAFWSKSWFPNKYKTVSISRYWCDDRMIEHCDEQSGTVTTEEKMKDNLKFKVGDLVIAKPNTESREKLGIITDMNPRNGHCLVAWLPERKHSEWCDDSMIEHSSKQSDTVALPEKDIEVEAVVPEQQTTNELVIDEKTPMWLREMMICIRAKVCHMFILSGNIFDQYRNRSDKYQTIYEYLAEVFKDRHIMIYSLSRGLQFATSETEQWFKARCKSVDGSRTSTADAPLSLLGEILSDESNKDEKRKPILFIDFAHNLIPAHVTSSERVVVERFERWSRDQVMRDNGSLIILLTPAVAGLAQDVRSSQSGAKIIKIQRPDYDARLERWQAVLADNGLKLNEGVTAEILARITNGLTLRQIAEMSAKAKAEGKPLDPEYIKNVKKKQIEDEFEGLIEVKMPKFGLDMYGGMDNVKDYLAKVGKNMLAGIAKRVPMGIMAVGPPGTGKTMIFECWAYDCGIIVIKLKNLRSKWVGETESNMEKVAALIDELAPVIVVEDEADQAETSRDTPSGDAGTSNRMRQMKFEFCSDPKRRGKVIWIRITNRDDLLDDAYKRKGRTDANIPFVLPDEKQLTLILPACFKQNGVSTNIIDFIPFAKQIVSRIYCTPADVAWMVMEADQLAEDDGKAEVESAHLEKAIAGWEMDLNPDVVDNQIILAINGSTMRLRPDNWEQQIAEAEKRIADRKTKAMQKATAGIEAIFQPKSAPEEPTS
ncbi:MAG: ATP-binding protein [Patescibacteria group bacterium]